MSVPDGAHPAGSASASASASEPYSRSEAGDKRVASRAVSSSIWLLEHAQDVVTVAVGVVLIVLAVVLLISGIADSLSQSKSVLSAAIVLVDRTLLVLILVEIVHTVVLSLRAHHLMAQPFIVVGLVAVIRRILFVLTPGTGTKATTSELALLIAMVAVFVAGLIAVSRFEKHDE
jgi:uncharacterized membrane protein (DUF373 family)